VNDASVPEMETVEAGTGDEMDSAGSGGFEEDCAACAVGLSSATWWENGDVDEPDGEVGGRLMECDSVEVMG
jgi:hypothetical protein